MFYAWHWTNDITNRHFESGEEAMLDFFRFVDKMRGG